MLCICSWRYFSVCLYGKPLMFSLLIVLLMYRPPAHSREIPRTRNRSTTWSGLSYPQRVKKAAGVSSLVPRSSPAPVFDRLQYAETKPEGLVNLTTWSVPRLTSQILDMVAYSHLYFQLQRSWRNKTHSSRETSPTSRTLPSLKQNCWRIVPLQALQIQKRLLFCYAS